MTSRRSFFKTLLGGAGAVAAVAAIPAAPSTVPTAVPAPPAPEPTVVRDSAVCMRCGTFIKFMPLRHFDGTIKYAAMRCLCGQGL